MRYKILLAACLLAGAAGAQSDTAVKLNDLKAPVSPASTLLGLSPSDVENQTDPHKLMMSLRNATDNFTALPNSYAVDIAPFKLFGKRGIAIANIDSKNYAEVFRQSLVLSSAFKRVSKEDNKEDTVASSQIGFGFKFALVRGRVNDEFLAAIADIRVLQGDLLRYLASPRVDSLVEANAQYRTLDSLIRAGLASGTDVTLLKQQKEALRGELRGPAVETLFPDKTAAVKAAITARIEAVSLDRYGGFIDIAGGVAVNFRNNDFKGTALRRGGLWLTFGYDNKKSGPSIAGIARYLYSPDVVLADPKLTGTDMQTFDAGGRFSLTTNDKKFLLSAEALYRSVVAGSDVPSSWRLMGNAEYEVGPNQRLTLSFGRNFDGTYYRGGNVASAINFIVGLGKQQVSVPKLGN
jgi:hypothetical protein